MIILKFCHADTDHGIICTTFPCSRKFDDMQPNAKAQCSLRHNWDRKEIVSLQFVTNRNHISQVSDYPSLPYECIFRPERREEVINDLLFVSYSCPVQILDVYCCFCLSCEFTYDLLSIWFAHLNSLAPCRLAKRAISVGFPRILHSHSHLFLSESLLFFPTVSFFPLRPSPKHISLPPLLTELPPSFLILCLSDALSCRWLSPLWVNCKRSGFDSAAASSANRAGSFIFDEMVGEKFAALLPCTTTDSWMETDAAWESNRLILKMQQRPWGFTLAHCAALSERLRSVLFSASPRLPPPPSRCSLGLTVVYRWGSLDAG